MTDQWFNQGKILCFEDPLATQSRLVMMLAMTNQELEPSEPNGAANRDVTTVSAFLGNGGGEQSIDEYDGGATGGNPDVYPAGPAAGNATTFGFDLLTVGTTLDGTNDRAELTSGNINFGATAAGTRNINGIFICYSVNPGTTDLDASEPVAWIDSGGFNHPTGINPAGGELQINWSATDGVLYIA